MGGTASKCQPATFGPLLSFGAQLSLGGHISRLVGTSNDLGRARSQNDPPPWCRAFIVGLVLVVDVVSIVDLVGMVDAVDLVDMVSKYRRHSQQDRHSLAWDNKTLTLLYVLEQPVFYFVCIAFTIK